MCSVRRVLGVACVRCCVCSVWRVRWGVAGSYNRHLSAPVTCAVAFGGSACCGKQEQHADAGAASCMLILLHAAALLSNLQHAAPLQEQHADAGDAQAACRRSMRMRRSIRCRSSMRMPHAGERSLLPSAYTCVGGRRELLLPHAPPPACSSSRFILSSCYPPFIHPSMHA